MNSELFRSYSDGRNTEAGDAEVTVDTLRYSVLIRYLRNLRFLRSPLAR